MTDEPAARLFTVAQTLRDHGALEAYGLLADGGACRMVNLGPAFGSKFLYFCQADRARPRALIHDKNVGTWLHAHAGFPRWTASWSPPGYGAYLQQMEVWAQRLGCEPDDVELCMFRSTLDPSNQWNED